MLTDYDIALIKTRLETGDYSIDDVLNEVAKAQRGEEVRRSIYAGIYACYKDGKAGAVDLTAREWINGVSDYVASIDYDGEWTIESYKSGKVVCWAEKTLFFPASTAVTNMRNRSIVQIDMSGYMDTIISGSCGAQYSGLMPQVYRNAANESVAEVTVVAADSISEFELTTPIVITGIKNQGA